VLGEDAVRSDPASLARYTDPYALPADAAARLPAAALLPADREQVQAVVRIAAGEGIALWPVSGGNNLAYGGGAARTPGDVMLDLRRMDRIVSVDPALACAVVEPGVRYVDLHAHLRDAGLSLWIDPPAFGEGSIVGNTLERGFGVTSYGEHADTHCGLEVVLPDGSVVRTGMAALGDVASAHARRDGYGPSFDGLFFQSNLGVVTQMGVWLMPAPEHVLFCHGSFRSEDDLGPLVEILRDLRLHDVLNGRAVVESPVRWMAAVSRRTAWQDGDGPLTPAALADMVRRAGIGWWNLRFGLYGPAGLTDARWRTARRALAAIPGARLSARAWRPGDPLAGAGDAGLAGVPSMAAMAMLRWPEGSGCTPGNGAHLDVGPICPATGADALRQYRLVRDQAAAHGFDYYGGFTAAPRFLHHIFAAIYDRTDGGQAARARELCRGLTVALGEAGYGMYRAHLDQMDLAAAQYAAHDHAALRLAERIKAALDPAGVLAPGKQGVWPGRPRARER